VNARISLEDLREGRDIPSILVGPAFHTELCCLWRTTLNAPGDQRNQRKASGAEGKKKCKSEKREISQFYERRGEDEATSLRK